MIAVGSNSKGSRRERELTNYLDDCGYAVLRAPSSGSATPRDLPDVLAGNGVDVFACELKASSGDPIYLDESEVDALVYFAENFGADPRVVARWDHDTTFYAFRPDELYRTDAGNYRVKKERCGPPHAFPHTE